MSALKHVMEVVDLLEDPEITGQKVKEFLRARGVDEVQVIEVRGKDGKDGKTDFLKVRIVGQKGKSRRGIAPTLGVIGRLGGIGARPDLIGMVSDADGAIIALAAALKIAELKSRGDELNGDVVITTHICPSAPTMPHKPVPMMRSPVDIFELLKLEVDPEMDAILSLDATKANLVINHTGFSITPVVKEGWILKVSEDLINIYVRVTGEPAKIVPITLQDILPFSTKVYHINSMMQPWIYTSAPVVGVATTSTLPVPGSATGATNIWALEQATRFVVEVAKDYTAGRARFYDENEWNIIVQTHGRIDEILKKGAPKK